MKLYEHSYMKNCIIDFYTVEHYSIFFCYIVNIIAYNKTYISTNWKIILFIVIVEIQKLIE